MKPDEATFVFSQDGDSCGGPDYQFLRVRILDAGGGPYIILRTSRWAIDPEGIDQFAKTLKDLVKQVKSDEEKMQEAKP